MLVKGSGVVNLAYKMFEKMRGKNCLKSSSSVSSSNCLNPVCSFRFLYFQQIKTKCSN
jgi:hypothetical protein